MRKKIFAFGFLFALCATQMVAPFCAHGPTADRNFIYAATIGTGISMSEPSHTPFTVHFLGHYRVGERFSAGVGSGLSFYETMLIPLFADAKFDLTRPRKFTPYVNCSGGYAFAANKNANGGLFLNPSFGVAYALPNQLKLQLSAGYELQKLERLKEAANLYFTSSFAEQLNHHLLTIKVGIVF